jgi:trehalose-6-phosphate synthase
MASDLVIVYHRQPYEEVEENGKIVFKENKSPNGIVPTLKAFSVGSTGRLGRLEACRRSGQSGFRAGHRDRRQLRKILGLPPAADGRPGASSFYHVTSKEAFWPILHSFKERYNYDPVDWPNFREVNWALPKPRPPRRARARGLGARLQSLAGAGLSAQAAARCADRLLPSHAVPVGGHVQRAALAARNRRKPAGLRRVGFHIPRYAANFVRSRSSLLEVGPVERKDVNPDFIWEGTALSDRRVPEAVMYQGAGSISSAPVGIDWDYIQEVRRFRGNPGKRQPRSARNWAIASLILSVGRTDYTKGGVQQLVELRAAAADAIRSCAARCG